MQTVLAVPFFSIITAAYNSASTVAETLLSLKSQTYTNFEHIVVDGGSSDGTIEILKKFKSTYSLSWISEKDKGISDALNKGVSRARGEYILVLQADDRLINKAILGIVYAKLAGDSADIYSFPVLSEFADGKKLAYRAKPFTWLYHFKTPYPHQGVFVHRRVYEKIGAFDNRFEIAMDYDFFYRALQAGISVKQEDTFVAIMKYGGIGSSQATLRKRIKEEFNVQKKNEKHIGWKIIQLMYRLFYPFYKFYIKSNFRNDL